MIYSSVLVFVTFDGKKVSRPLTVKGLFMYGPLRSGAYLVGEPSVGGQGDQCPVQACPLSGVHCERGIVLITGPHYQRYFVRPCSLSEREDTCVMKRAVLETE